MTVRVSCGRCQAALTPAARFCAACGKEQLSAEPTLVANTELGNAAPSYAPLPPMRLLPGTLLHGVYEIEDVIGEGGMGVVYRAHDTRRQRSVAIKCLHSYLCGDAEVRRRFAREARLLRSWSHPNVVATYDFIEQDYLLAIIMEYVEGLTLKQHLQKWRGSIPFKELSAIFAGVFEAMDEAHRHGIVHRDLKPDNVTTERETQNIVPRRGEVLANYGLRCGTVSRAMGRI